jgi:hypothetical protein
LVGLPLLPGALLLLILVLPLLLRALSLLSLVGLPLLLGALLLLVLVLALPLLLLRMLRLRLSRVLLLRLGLLVLALWLLGVILLFVSLLLLCIPRNGACEKQRQNGGAGDSNYFHRYYLRDCSLATLALCAGLPRRSLADRHPFPMWILEREWNSPETFRIHRTTPMTTTPFKIDLMDPCMGMKRFTSHRRTPTTTRTSSS